MSKKHLQKLGKVGCELSCQTWKMENKRHYKNIRIYGLLVLKCQQDVPRTVK